MHSLGQIWKFKTKNFVVIVDAVEEDAPDLSWDEAGEVTDKINAGEYILFCARARVLFRGHEISSDYLGNCVYQSLEAFNDRIEAAKAQKEYRKQGKDVLVGSYITDMIHNAINGARATLIEYRSIPVRAK